MDDESEVKKALLGVARKRADIIFCLPEQDLAVLCKVSPTVAPVLTQTIFGTSLSYVDRLQAC